MSIYRTKFNPTQYWANKPYCVLCKKRKVKYGNICGECQKEGHWDGKVVSSEKGDNLSQEKMVKTFDVPVVERKDASPTVKSIIGYLKDCAAAVLRTTLLVDIRNNKDISFLQAPADSLDLLANGGFELKDKEAFDFLFKLISRPNEFDLILGTLFLKGEKGKEGEKDKKKICAPLLYFKLDATKSEDDKRVIFSLKEDTVFLNQALISSVVETKDEEELEIRFQDLYDNQPTWPLNLEGLNNFLINLSNTFSGILKDKSPTIKNFINFDDLEDEHGINICPTNMVVLLPKPEAEGTVVDELNAMLKNLLDNTGLDYIFSENAIVENNLSDEGAEGLTKAFEQKPEEWHNIWPIDLSEAKKNVIFSCRKNSITVVSGPPGTGKSYTIAAVIIDHLLAGKRVLFVSRMDKAVEVVVSQLENFTGPFTIARSGGRNAQRVLADKLELLTGPNSPVRSITKSDINKLEDTYNKTEEKLKDLERQFANLLCNEREWAKIKDFIDETRKKLKKDTDFSGLCITKERGENLKQKVKGADGLLKNKKFFLSTWWGQLSLDKVKRILDLPEETVVEELLAALDKAMGDNQKKEIEKEFVKFNDVNGLWSEIQELNNNIRNTGRDILQKSLLGNLYLVVNNHQKRVEIRNFIQSLKAANLRRKMLLKKNVNVETLLSAFPCWASTTGHLSQILPINAGMFDLVIFDEASQCDLASAAPALYRGNRVLIVGDPKQLNHVVFLGKQAEFSALAKNGVPTEMQSTYRFSQRSLFDVAEDRIPQQNYFMLDEHFRSEPHIISFSNQKFYENKLRLMTQRPVMSDNHAIEIEYVDGRRTEGTVNPKEIDAIFKHIQKIIASSDDKKPTTIGILSPFRDQVDAISKELPKYLTIDRVEKHKIVIGTAHSLQGDEKDVVILSLSICQNFHHGTLNFLERPNVFNVSITRAKKKLIVISSIKPVDLPNGLLKEFFTYATSTVDKTIPLDKFDSKFEKDVADELLARKLKVWPQYESAGFFIDLVVGDGNNFIAVECDGPSHYDLKSGQNFKDVWRQRILERAGWKFVRISYYEWENDRGKCIKRVITEIEKFK